MKILCLFVRHGTERHPEAINVLDHWYEGQGLMEQRTLWIVDNARAAEQPAERLGPNTVLRSGDNRSWEFSAWSHVLRQAREENITFDVIHFVTSAFDSLYRGYLQHFQREMLSYVVARKSCLGHIDSYPQPVKLGEVSSHSWIRTCFFFLPWQTALSFSPWVTYQNRTLVFNDPNSREFKPDAPLSLDYQAHITHWLEGRDMGGHTWHSPVSLGLDENQRFQKKTLAILNEHQLAINLRAAGVRLVDFCWLYFSRTNPLFLCTEAPPELDQLKFRRKVLGIPE